PGRTHRAAVRAPIRGERLHAAGTRQRFGADSCRTTSGHSPNGGGTSTCGRGPRRYVRQRLRGFWTLQRIGPGAYCREAGGEGTTPRLRHEHAHAFGLPETCRQVSPSYTLTVCAGP